ncbi:autotransporter domain-containing protein [Mesorhizobium sp. AR02]|nr:autotransporter domain-containing protein [Mesorhizobium sp. AR02]
MGGGGGANNSGGGGGGKVVDGDGNDISGKTPDAGASGPSSLILTNSGSYEFVGVGGGGGGSWDHVGGDGSAGDLTVFGVSLTVNRSILVGGGGGGAGAFGVGGVGGAGTVLLEDGASLSVGETLLVGGMGGSGASSYTAVAGGGAGGSGAVTVDSTTSIAIGSGGAIILGGTGVPGVLVGSYLGPSGAGGAGTLNLAGALNFQSGGSFTVNATGTFNLGNAVANGTVAGTISGLSSLTNNGAINFNQSNAVTFSPAISGDGTVTQNSGGTVLDGANTYTGATTVNGGVLSVNGSIASSVLTTVNSGGTLGGTGTVGNTTIVGGVLAPGNSIGTITVAGDLTFGAGSTYSVEVSPVTADRTNVTGTADLSGGTVAVIYLPGTFVAKSYTILHADGGLGGTAFAGIDAPTLPGLTSSLVYDYTANDVYLRTTAEPTIGTGLNENQKSVDTALLDFFDRTGSLPGAFAGLDANGLSQVSGEVAAGAANAGIDSADQFINALDAQAGQGEAAPAGGGTATAYAEDGAGGDKDQFAPLGIKASHNADLVGSVFASRWQAWGAVYGGSQKIGGDAGVGSHDTNSDIFGVAGGIVRNWGDSRLGVAMGGGSSSFSLSDGLGSGHANTFNVGVFGRQGFGDAYIGGVLAYGFNDTNTSRAVPGDTLEASFNAQTWSGRVEGGYRFATPVAVLTPYAAFQATAYHLPGYAETSAGSGVFALGYGSQTTTATRFELGLNLDKDILLQDGAKLTLSGRAAWAINGSTGRKVTATFQDLPGATFTIDGAEPDTNAALLNASATYTSSSGLFASLGFQGEFSGNVQSYAGKAKIGISW